MNRSANPVRLTNVDSTNVDELARFFVGQTSRDNSAVPRIAARLSWMAANPALTPEIPFGWAGRDENGAIVGAMLCVPFRFLVRGKIETFVMNSAFYADDLHRGLGALLFLAFRALNGRHVIYSTTSNKDAARVWEAARAHVLPKTEYELLGILRPGPVLEEFVFRRFGKRAALVGRALGVAANTYTPCKLSDTRGRVTIGPTVPEEAACAADVADHEFCLLRDASFLRWRYFEDPETGTTVHKFLTETDKGFIGVSIQSRGYRGQLRVLNISDIWGRVSPQALPLALSAMAKKYRGEVDAIVIRCPSDDVEQAATGMGFKKRTFPNAIGWYLDRRRILPERFVIPAGGTEMV